MTAQRPVRETKLQAICTELTQLTNRLGPDGRLPPVRELARTLPASIATINDALRELEGQKLIVRRHGVGVFVASHLPRRRLALLCRPEFFSAPGASPFWGLLVEHARQRAQEAHEELAFWFAQDDRLTHDQRGALHTGHVQGVVGIGIEYPLVDEILSRSLPFVAFAGPAPHTVVIDQDDIVAQGKTALEALGCRQIVAIPAPIASLPPQEAGYRWGRDLLAQPATRRPDGIVSRDDMLTAGLLGALHESGVALGPHLRLATHANAGSPILLGWEAQIVRLIVDPAEIVTRLFALLEAQFSDPPVAPQRQRATVTMAMGERVR